ncbi:MAG: hypothetical protein M3R59_07410 [Verrucomicrobiota bacterium]|nr:hypothetical protein [Verrucomicrobiota bacterium]
MKRLLCLLLVCASVIPALQQTRAADVSVNFFYDNLNGGNWYQVGDYGYVWQPDAATDPRWRPYADGYWAYTDQGWTWVSNEDFGWATYHYGRWTKIADRGWCWVPGYEWAPAWVSWRTGGNYVGWAPLPPAGPHDEIVYEGRPITGHVDAEFGIGPSYYNFVDVRYLGEPVLRSRIYAYDQNVTYINSTVNVTNITVTNNKVYNYGPDIAVVNRYSTRPVPRLTIRAENIDPATAVKENRISKVEGGTLMLAAPLKLNKPTTKMVPPVVKAKIEQPKFERGWTNTDPKVKAQLEQKFKKENSKNIPKTDLKPNANADATVSARANPAAGAASEPRISPAATTAPVATGTSGATASPAPGKGKHNKMNRQKGNFENPTASATPAASATPTGKERARGLKSMAREMEGPKTNVPMTDKSEKLKKNKKVEKLNATPTVAPQVEEKTNGHQAKMLRGPNGPMPVTDNTNDAQGHVQKTRGVEKQKAQATGPQGNQGELANKDQEKGKAKEKGKGKGEKGETGAKGEATPPAN